MKTRIYGSWLTINGRESLILVKRYRQGRLR
jgi:hypothetical protein